LPPPPAADSPTQSEDLKSVLQAQRAAHAHGTIEHAVADVELNCGRIAAALDNPGALARAPQVLGFLNQAAREAAALTGPAKIYWKRTRPYAFSSEVEPLADMARDSSASSSAQANARSMDVGGAAGRCAPSASTGMNAATIDLAHSSYPSGHSAFGTVCAILLADMVPEKRAALFARGLDFAHSRMVVGAHFPSDLEGGRLTGTVAAELLMQNPTFTHDLVVERASLRAALGLPAEPVN
jgi:acid phosphatase (class A)